MRAPHCLSVWLSVWLSVSLFFFLFLLLLLSHLLFFLSFLLHSFSFSCIVPMRSPESRTASHPSRLSLLLPSSSSFSPSSSSSFLFFILSSFPLVCSFAAILFIFSFSFMNLPSLPLCKRLADCYYEMMSACIPFAVLLLLLLLLFWLLLLFLPSSSLLLLLFLREFLGACASRSASVIADMMRVRPTHFEDFQKQLILKRIIPNSEERDLRKKNRDKISHFLKQRTGLSREGEEDWRKKRVKRKRTTSSFTVPHLPRFLTRMHAHCPESCSWCLSLRLS